MVIQSINLELPDEIYQRLQGAAAESQRPLEEIISLTIRGNLPPTLTDLPAEQRDQVADLQILDDEALWAIARKPFPPQRWRRHRQLLHKAEDMILTDEDQAELADLRIAVDQFVIRRSYALALLKWRGHTIISSATAELE